MAISNEQIGQIVAALAALIALIEKLVEFVLALGAA
jgi:hypothetical protein